jgi:hypothetical protein
MPESIWPFQSGSPRVVERPAKQLTLTCTTGERSLAKSARTLTTHDFQADFSLRRLDSFA